MGGQRGEGEPRESQEKDEEEPNPFHGKPLLTLSEKRQKKNQNK
jgi:hypothetical protein